MLDEDSRAPSGGGAREAARTRALSERRTRLADRWPTAQRFPDKVALVAASSRPLGELHRVWALARWGARPVCTW